MICCGLTGELRLERPSTTEEMNWAIRFFRNAIFPALPEVMANYQKDRASLGLSRGSDPQIGFHSWVGGDRDGNPNITTEITKQALATNRHAAVDNLREAVQNAIVHVSISANIVTFIQQDLVDLALIVMRSGKARQINARNSGEVFRRALSGVDARLMAIMSDTNGGVAYEKLDEFNRDITVISRVLDTAAPHLTQQYIQPIVVLAKSFGFRTVTLDIRQNSGVTTDVICELWRRLGLPVPEYGTPDWSKQIRSELASTDPIDLDGHAFGEMTRETLNLFALIRDEQRGLDPHSIGPFILSMTRSVDDLLGVALIARYSWVCTGGQGRRHIATENSPAV